MRPAALLAAALAAASLTAAAPRAPRVPGAAGRPEDRARVALSPQDEFDLGLRHYARGEYRQAADAFARAGARLELDRKPDARYWTGLAWLGAGDAVQARSAFEDVIATSSSRRALARLGLAQSWELAGRADRAFATYAALSAEPTLGEATGTTLSRYAALAAARGEEDVARRARERLLREAPNSMEAASVRLEAVRRAALPGAPR